LFFVSLFTATLFILQIIIDEHILIGEEIGVAYFLGNKITRFYNHPDMLFFFIFMALYHNPMKGIPKYLSMILFTAALLGAFHRSLIGCFFISLLIGFVIKLPYLKRVYFVTVTSVILLFFIVFIGNRFVHSRTYLDIKSVVTGNISAEDFDMDYLGKSTFTFRVLHLLERNDYLLENRQAMFFGAGLIPEDSKLVNKMFDFKIGLIEEITGQTAQIETSDISYSVLVLRFGYIGTALYLLLIVYLMVFFYKKRENKYGFFTFLYLVLSIGDSFFAANLLFPVNFLLPLISYHIILKTDSITIVNEC